MEKGWNEGSGTPDMKHGNTGDIGRDDRASTQSSFTGIAISNAPAKSNIEVSFDADDAGERYPLVYVLVCQQLP